MKKKNNNDVGSSRAARNLLDTVDSRISDPIGSIVRIGGFLLWAFVAYLLWFDALGTIVKVRLWLVVYLSYLLLLEIIRNKWTDNYDKIYFRGIRIIFNVGIISWLISIYI